MTQAQLAELLGVGVRTVQSWEGDENVPQGDNLVKLAEALETTTVFILKGLLYEIPVIDYPVVHDAPLPTPPEPSTEGSPAEQLLHMLGVRAGLRRVARELTDKDLIAVAYTIARADRWPIEELRKLDAWRDAILEQRRAGEE